MKEVILDTDTVSYYFRGEKKVVEKVNSYVWEFGFINLSLITYYEIMHGLYYKDAKKQTEKFEGFLHLNQLLPLTLLSANISAKIYADLRKMGNPIGHNDILIAGIAIENNLKIITNNVKDFGRIDGLEIDNWAA